MEDSISISSQELKIAANKQAHDILVEFLPHVLTHVREKMAEKTIDEVIADLWWANFGLDQHRLSHLATTLMVIMAKSDASHQLLESIIKDIREHQ